jgi:hypothetical protein
MTYQLVLIRWLGPILAVAFGLALALAVVSGSHPGGFAGHGVLATGATAGGPGQPPHPNI